jgi:hypothetical protein
MFRVLGSALASSLVLLVPAGGSGEPERTPLTIIVNAENPVAELSVTDLSRIYLGKKTLWDSGPRISPAMLGEDRPAVKEFIEKDVRRTVDQYRAYWKHMVFSGGGTAPRSFRTPAQVIDLVAREPGGIGLLAGPPGDDRVKVVEVKVH